MIDKGNKKLIIISIIFMLCLLSFYGVINYYSNKDIELETVKKGENINENDITLADTITLDEEIILGDATNDDGCEREVRYCDTGTIGCNVTKCCTTTTYASAPQPYGCIGGSWSNGQCTEFNVVGDKKTKCVKCKKGYELNDGKCQMICKVEGIPGVIKPAPTSISIGHSYYFTVSVRFTEESSPKCAPVMSVNNGSWKSHGSRGQFEFKVTPTTGCTSSDYIVSAGGTRVTSGTVQVKSDWLPEKSIACAPLPSGGVTNSYDADTNGKDKYYTSPDGEGNYCGYRARGECCYGCGPPPGSGKEACYKNKNGELKWTSDTKFGTKTSKTKSECKNCYGDTSRILSFSNDVDWLGEKNSKYSIFIPGITSEEKCKKEKAPKACVPTATGSPSETTTISATTCEEEVKKETKDEMNCKGNPYYTIKCTNKTSTKFDLGDDGIITSTNNMLVGQGFKYGITVSISRSCTGTFKLDTWTKAYDYTAGVIKAAQKDLDNKKNSLSSKEKTKLESIINEYEKKQRDLKSFVTAYKNYDLDKSSSISSTITVDNYKVKGKSQTLTTELVSTVVQKGSGKYKKTKVDLSKYKIDDVYNYTWSNEEKPTIIKLVPPKKYINSNGEIANKGIDAGNKIYVDYYVDPKTYSLSINVKGVGGKLTISNKKCNIEISDQEIIYRPIDVSNPFINKDWKKGINWSNEKMDFTKIIDKDIWSK